MTLEAIKTLFDDRGIAPSPSATNCTIDMEDRRYRFYVTEVDIHYRPEFTEMYGDAKRTEKIKVREIASATLKLKYVDRKCGFIEEVR